MYKSKFTVKQQISLNAITMGYKIGTSMRVKLTLLDSDEVILGIKEDTTKVQEKGILDYRFTIESIAKSLGINDVCKVKYVKGWIDSDGDGTIDYDEEVWIEVLFSVENIPNVMRNKLNWSKSAELMDLWFSKKAKEMTPSEKKGEKFYDKDYTNTTMFTMDWLFGFDRVKNGYRNLKIILLLNTL